MGYSQKNYSFQLKFLRLIIPNKPIRQEPNNHTAAGTGTAAGASEKARLSVGTQFKDPRMREDDGLGGTRIANWVERASLMCKKTRCFSVFFYTLSEKHIK